MNDIYIIKDRWEYCFKMLEASCKYANNIRPGHVDPDINTYFPNGILEGVKEEFYRMKELISKKHTVFSNPNDCIDILAVEEKMLKSSQNLETDEEGNILNTIFTHSTRDSAD